MKDQNSTSTPAWSLPYTTPQPGDPKKAKKLKILRIAIYAVVIAAMVTPVIQFQTVTMRNQRRAAEFDANNPDWQQGDVDAQGKIIKRPKQNKGAIGRWRHAVRRFWAGDNIYQKHQADPSQSKPAGKVWLHPNMPFTVMLLTPFAYLPVWAMALSWSILKVIVIVATLGMAASIANDGQKKMPDWVIALGLAWSLPLVIGDIQHGNTNTFVLGAIVLHLWLYRRGRDYLAGLPLAIAICIKMTPALFVLFWLYQRNWKLLCGTIIALLILGIVIPAAAVGPARFMELKQTWLDNLIVPGLVKGAWYPVHINQSLPGMVSRLFLDGPNGNIYWNPDDNPYEMQKKFGWINLASLTPEMAKMAVRLGQVLIIGMMAWAIGIRKLGREDGRRSLHFAMVLLAMMLLNQRTWDHHAAVLVPAAIAIWYAIGFGNFSRLLRKWALGLMLSAGVLVWGHGGELYRFLAKICGQTKQVGKEWADIAEAYGPTFFFFVIMFITVVIVSLAMKKSQPAYADERQKLSK